MDDFMNYDFNITDISVACHVMPGKGTPVHQNRSSHGLAIYTGGENIFDFGSKKLPVAKNDIIYLPKNSSYVVSANSSSECYAINFNISKQISFQPFVIHLKNANNFIHLFRKSEKLWQTKETGYHMECKANLYSIICAMIKEYQFEYLCAKSTQLIEPAISYIHKNYSTDRISISYLSHICEMSETYFRKIFKNTKGISPLKYINELRIERAKELIASQMYSISEVCELSGFNDDAYFSREFKKTTGFSPSQYLYENRQYKK